MGYTRMMAKQVQAQVSGLVFSSAKRWMMEWFGDEVYRRFVAQLPEAERNAWEARVFRATDWYPASMFIHMHEAVMRLFGGENPDVFREGAGHIAVENLGTVMQVLMKIGTPAFISSRFPVVYAEYFNVGELRLIDFGTEMAEVELVGAQIYGKAICEGILGWTRQALIVAGATEVEARHVECLFCGGKRCRFSYRWR